jgi:L-ribulokinase
MVKNKYVIGIDYGTESGRALLVNAENGEEVAQHVTLYPHGVIDQKLPGLDTALKEDWALQHPDDYLQVLRVSVPEVIKTAGISPASVIGIGIDFTSCTMLPVDEQGEPLCFDMNWQVNPHSWVKLWKHHAAQEEALKITEKALETEQSFLGRYGYALSSEWMLPKVWQILNEAPDLYQQTFRFVEAADWVVWQLTGSLARNSCSAGYKGIWHKANGYPDKNFLNQLDPRLKNVYETKLAGEVLSIGSKAGELTEDMAGMMGLAAGTAVAVSIIDAHAAVPGVGVTSGGKMVLAMGTSLCHMMLSEHEKTIPGICGVVEDGIVPGFFGYESGQAAVGDIFAWFVKHGVPEYITKEAEQLGISVHDLLEQKAEGYKPGETGLLALDWWNGSRSPLMDADLTGLLIGYSLSTKPEEIYRALLETTAFGTRSIIETYESAGIPVDELYACGGLPQKNKLLMQIFADITGKEIQLADSSQPVALGAAIFGAVAAGSKAGGYDHIQEAAKRMARVKAERITPNPKHSKIYDELYDYYKQLQNWFGKEQPQMMHGLKKLRGLNSDE